MAIDDTGRLLAMTTALGADELSPVSFHAEEQISGPFTVSVDAVSQSSAIDPDGLLFKPACLHVTQGQTTRYFNGVVRAVAASGMPVRGMWRYTLSIVPKLWFMGQTSDCRVFQQKTTTDILQTICGETGQTVSIKTYGSLTPLEYVTQYNETDLHFAQRLLEEAGLYYFFEHTEGDHTMVVTDQNQGFPSTPKPVLAVVHSADNIDALSDWRQVRATAHGSVRLMDYDPAQPSTLPDGTTATTFATSGAPKRDVMRWPALSTDASVVTARTRIGIEAAEAEVSLTEAAGANHMLAPGSRFTLLRDPFSGASNVDYVVRGISHHGTDESWVGGAERAEYGNALSAFPASVPWRQRVLTRRPQLAGIFAAIVVGNAGEEIHADSLGRIKIRLMWDHRQDTVAGQAVWVRVMQPWAGDSWGWQHLPRVGTEVAVSFMDGDPDRPVVVGGFYNANMTVPFAVPGEQTKSGFRSRSSLGGATSNFSEFSIDDKTGGELVFLHAEKNMTREVENDDKILVSHDQTIVISNTQTITVDAGRAATIQKGGDSLTVQNGDLKVAVSTGSISMEAAVSITLKVGANTITIDQSGVSIKGAMVKVEGQSMVQSKAAMIETSASGMLTLKGGVVMVN